MGRRVSQCICCPSNQCVTYLRLVPGTKLKSHNSSDLLQFMELVNCIMTVLSKYVELFVLQFNYFTWDHNYIVWFAKFTTLHKYMKFIISMSKTCSFKKKCHFCVWYFLSKNLRLAYWWQSDCGTCLQLAGGHGRFPDAQE